MNSFDSETCPASVSKAQASLRSAGNLVSCEIGAKVTSKLVTSAIALYTGMASRTDVASDPM